MRPRTKSSVAARRTSSIDAVGVVEVVGVKGGGERVGTVRSVKALTRRGSSSETTTSDDDWPEFESCVTMARASAGSFECWPTRDIGHERARR